MYEIYESSPIMRGEEKRDRSAKFDPATLGLDRLQCGQSICVPFSDISESLLRNIVSKHNRNGLRYKVALHTNCYEVGRVK